MHVWGCPEEAWIYNPHKRKLDSWFVSGYFIGYPEKFKGYRFYRLNHNSRIIKICNAKLIENIEVSGIVDKRIVDINKIRVDVPTSTIVPNIIPILEEQSNNEWSTPWWA